MTDFEARNLVERSNRICNWNQCEGAEEVFSTDCGHLFEFTSDGPVENHFTHCPYCGGILGIKK